MKEQDACIGKGSGRISWVVATLVLAGVAGICAGGYVIYKYRIRSYMDSEIRAIMAQYMPLDSQNDVHQPLREDS